MSLGRLLLSEHAKNSTDHHEEKSEEGGISAYLLNEEGALTGLAVIAILLIFSLILEKMHHKATMYARRTGKKHVGAIIKKVTTELMILGLVSFLFFTLLQTKVFDKMSETFNRWTGKKESGEEGFSEEFVEFLHMFLFVVVLVYVGIVIYLLILGGFIKKQWKKLEQRAQDDEPPRRMGKLISYFNVAIKYYHYVNLRRNFIEVHRLPPDYNYYSYLKQIYSQTFSEIVELNYKVWIIVLVVMTLDYVDHRWLGDSTFNVFTGVVFLCSLYFWFIVIQMRNKMVDDVEYFVVDTQNKPKDMFMTVTPANEKTHLLPPPSKAMMNNSPTINDDSPQIPSEKVAIDIRLDFIPQPKKPRWKFLCIPCLTAETEYEAMFPFGRPHSLVYIAQALVFVQSVYISVSIMLLSKMLSDNIWVMVLNIVIPLVNITFVIGATVPIICQILAIHPKYHYAHSEQRKIHISKIKKPMEH